MSQRTIAVAGAALVFVAPAYAQIIADGDTIKFEGTTYRLWGIDAAEVEQGLLV